MPATSSSAPGAVAVLVVAGEHGGLVWRARVMSARQGVRAGPSLKPVAGQEFDLIEDLPDDGSRQKETYARFGLAAYSAQVFEAGLINLIAIATAYASRSGKPMTIEDVDALNDELFGHTSGRLVTLLAGIIPSEADHLDACRLAVSERNRLMHRFFREHAQDFLTPSGMQRMVDDADSVRILLEGADAETDAMSARLLERSESPATSCKQSTTSW